MQLNFNVYSMHTRTVTHTHTQILHLVYTAALVYAYTINQHTTKLLLDNDKFERSSSTRKSKFTMADTNCSGMEKTILKCGRQNRCDGLVPYSHLYHHHQHGASISLVWSFRMLYARHPPNIPQIQNSRSYW